ncbi:hypothetical protein Pth03_40550 [Planotetraspora thailandica]|uniref:Ricin B lectin domain-containing protein n=1 Tax=Planotetraspora thailandica TaxID=487172 RepID=A0A8J3V666_9ACTN|nr:RICIN domain-containing protein [Planotetraspora thailandica]GII55666.1 hypothetical protein Pth03_40550 [Planotetraspora thailandica]
MSRIPLTLKKITMTLAVGALAAAGLLAVSPGAAQAASGFTARLAPISNQLMFLDVSGGSTSDGAKIIQWTLSGSNQGWYFKPVGDNYQIVNVKSGKCITSDGVAGDQLYQWVCTSDTSQLWSTGLTPSDLHVHSIRNVKSGLYMDVSGGSTSRGAAIDTWYWNGGEHQYFAGLVY